ncbi:MAG: peptidoglycan DD-metalloendopeptidase family protein [Idiomarina sp.]|nr:peptidoglycan DD-metalloendopeptidase family protein [Idiomarina sp.]
MNSAGRRLSALLLSAALSAAGVSVAVAQQVDAREEQARAEAQLQQLQRDIQQRRRQLERRQQQLSGSERALQDVERQINRSSQAIATTERELQATQTRIRELEGEQEALTQSLRQQAELLADQIEAAYRSGDYNFLRMLLNQENPARFERMLEYYRHLNDARLEQLATLHATEEELFAVQRTLTREQQQLAQRREQQEAQRRTLATQQQEQESRLAALRQEQQSENVALESLLQSEQELTELLAALADVLRSSDITLAGLANLRGQLSWPVRGTLRHRFGQQRSSQVQWRGVVLNTEAEAPVQSIADGRVLYSDWLRGFGLVIVVDHGEGYMSLYGYNQALMYDVGEPVRQGDTIALAGQSGGQSEPGVYFEIRHRGDPVNPATFMRR